MTKEVAQLMSGLRGDHRNMVMLLDLLDAEMKKGGEEIWACIVENDLQL
jgi:hypothetical protein